MIYEVSATVTKGSKSAKKAGFTADKSATVKFEIPDTVAECVKLWGEKVVHSQLRASVVTGVQALVRRGLVAGKTPKEIQQIVDSYKPGVATPGKSKVQKGIDAFEKMTPEERKAFLAMVKEKISGK